LITDIELKNASGIDLLSKVRSGDFSQTAHDIPIIVLSVNSYKELIQQCALFDVNDFLVKPISSVNLTQKIHKHLQDEKFIQPISYYAEMMQKLAQPHASKEYSKRSAAIVLEVDKKRVEPEKNLDKAVVVLNKRDFLHWPEGVTTGHYQLDRRLKNVAFNISYFYNVFVDNRKLVAIDNARKRACESADYLLHIGRNFQQYEHRPDFLSAFKICLDTFDSLIVEIASVNLKNRNQVLALLRKLASWWTHTCNRPLIQNMVDPSDS
jgi:YesN/AraC family two-component response regulator